MKIVMTQGVHDFLTEVVSLVPAEVGGLGYVREIEEEPGTLYVDEVFLMPQDVSSAHVSFKEGATADAMIRAYEEGKFDRLRFSWHSHSNMEVFWSNIDEAAIEDYCNAGAPWLVSLVMNKKGDMLGRVDVMNVPIAGRAKFDRIGIEVETVDRTAGAAAAAVRENVEILRWSPKKVDAKASVTRFDKQARQQEKDEHPDGTPVKRPLTAHDEHEVVLFSSGEQRVRVGKGAGVLLEPSEIQDLLDKGFDPDKMTADQILEESIRIDMEKQGLVDVAEELEGDVEVGPYA